MLSLLLPCNEACLVELILREHEVEGCTLFESTLSPDGPSLADENTLYCREADSSAGELVEAVQPLKRLEELFHECRIETCPVITNKVDHPAPGFSGRLIWGSVWAPVLFGRVYRGYCLQGSEFDACCGVA